MIGINFPSFTVQAGPSSLGEAVLNENEVLKLRAKVHPSVLVFKNKKLVEDLLDHILFPRDQAKRWPWSPDKIFSDAVCHLHGVSVSLSYPLIRSFMC